MVRGIEWAVMTGLAAIAVASPALAQWTSDASVNTVVADGGGEQTVPITRPAAGGGVWVYFYDSGAGTGYKPTIQRLAADGTRVFGGNGIVLANRSNTATFTSDMKVGADGNAYAAFDDNGGQVTVQKIEPNGNLPWGASGIQAPTLAGSLGNRVAVCADGTIVVAGAVSNVLQLTRMNPDGTFMPGESWSLAESGRALQTSDLISGGNAGDVILLWVRAEGTNPVTSRKGLKIQKWNGTHAALWNGSGGPGSPIDVYTSNATPSRGIQNGYFPPILPDGSGGAVVAWYDTGAARDAWLQHVLPNGSQRFAQDGLAVSTTTSTTEFRLSASAVYLNAVDEYVVAFERSNPVQSMFGLGAQRITSTGNLLWGASGEGQELIPINSGNHKAFISVGPAPTDDAAVAWLEYTGANGPMLVNATRLDGSGAAVWSPGTLGVATTPSIKGRLSLSGVAGSDMLVATWQDNGAGTNDVKAQNINMDRTLGIPPCTGDVNGDHVVDLADLAIQLAHFGTASGATLADGDLNGDGAVDLGDLAILLGHFGINCL